MSNKSIMKIISIILLLLFTECTFSQENNSMTKRVFLGISFGPTNKTIPNTYEQSAMYNLTSFPEYNLLGAASLNSKAIDFSNFIGLNFNYFRSEDYSLDGIIGTDIISIKVPNYSMLDSVDKISYNASKKRIDVKINLGISRHFVFDRFSLFTGGNIVFLAYGSEELSEFYSSSNIATGMLNYSLSRKINGKNGFSAGIGNYVGVRYAFDKFQIGSDLSYAFLFSKYGGPATCKSVSTDSNQNTLTSTIETNSRISSLELSHPTFSLNLNINLK